jgi:hypothetical protein
MISILSQILSQPFGAPGTFSGLVAAVIGLASGGYLAVSGLIRTVHQAREKRLVEAIGVEASSADELRHELRLARTHVEEYHVLCDRLLIQCQLAGVDPKELERLKAIVAAVDPS